MSLSDKREPSLDDASADSKREPVGTVLIDAQFIHEPSRSKSVLATAVDQRGGRKWLFGTKAYWHDGAKDWTAASRSFEFEVLEVPAAGWEFSQVQPATVSPQRALEGSSRFGSALPALYASELRDYRRTRRPRRCPCRQRRPCLRIPRRATLDLALARVYAPRGARVIRVPTSSA